METWKIRIIKINLRAIYSITQHEKRKCELKSITKVKIQWLQAKSEISESADKHFSK